MRYEVPVKVAKGKVTENRQRLADIISSLEDNAYTIVITSVNPLVSERDCQKAYFAMIDTCVMETGNSRYVIHEEFKKYSEIDTTTGFTKVQWLEYLDKFRYWAYNEFDCIV